ncbi:hypothetical protein BJ508DRAFT_375044 [Ascobolus immersus RN42]|uniref:Uncharacterized protein n=1 Tax=Ascobolus immersus RN42 TaxID=1160509 RepID=A0A3N4IPG0_ASCIM|nr:hypothetical protein BJ508DRAFT_375044 [Ascobolus immersus RN42]
MVSTFHLRLHVPDWFTDPRNSASRAAILDFIRFPNLLLTLISTILYGRVVFDGTFSQYLGRYLDSAAVLTVLVCFFINVLVLVYTLSTFSRVTTPRNKLVKALLHFLAGAVLVTSGVVLIFKGRLFRHCPWGNKGVCELFGFYNALLYGAIFSSFYVAGQWWKLNANGSSVDEIPETTPPAVSSDPSIKNANESGAGEIRETRIANETGAEEIREANPASYPQKMRMNPAREKLEIQTPPPARPRQKRE